MFRIETRSRKHCRANKMRIKFSNLIKLGKTIARKITCTSLANTLTDEFHLSSFCGDANFMLFRMIFGRNMEKCGVEGRLLCNFN